MTQAGVDLPTVKRICRPQNTITVKRDEHNIDDLFNRAGQKLGEGFHDDYWQAHYDAEDPMRPKLELVFILKTKRHGKH